jgi:outer membrane protein TolC
MTHALVLVTFLAAAASVASAAAQPAPLRLTVAEALSRAADASHRLAEVRARKDGADAAVGVRRAASLPTATASGGFTRTGHVPIFGFPNPEGGFTVIYPDIPNNWTTRVGAQWPIYTAGRTDALERAAAAEASAVGEDLETARADLRFEVQRAYWALATALETVRVLHESLERADAEVRDARERLAVGLVPPNEVLGFEAQRSQEELQLIEAENLRESSLIDLRRLIGADPDTPIELADPLEAPPAFPEVTDVKGPGPVTPESAAVSSAFITRALAERPERKALTFRLDGAQARADAARAGYLPTVALGGGYDFANPNPRIFPRQGAWKSFWDISINASWTFFDSGRTRAEVAEAHAAIRAAEERLKDLDTLVAADVRQRLLDLRSSLAQVRASEAGVKSAAEARRVTGQRFAVGVATNTDVLVAQDQLITAELARARALANVRLAEARLERTLGIR